MRALSQWFASNHGTYRGWIRLELARLEQGVGLLRSVRQIDWTGTSRLVFVCQGNIMRSAYAEACARRAGMATASFGLATTTGLPADPLAIRTAEELGTDLSSHRTTSVRDFQLQPGDVLRGRPDFCV